MNPGGSPSYVVVFDEPSGSERSMAVNAFGGLAWLDDNYLVASGSNARPGPGQLTVHAYPDGASSRLTNDLNSYDGISLTTDRGALVTTMTERRVSVWVGDAGGGAGSEIVPSALAEASGYGQGVTWAGDVLVYTGGRSSLMSVPAGGGSPEEISSSALWPAATSDWGAILYGGFGENGPGLWKRDRDNGRVTQLVNGMVGWPVVTPDDRQVVFLWARDGNQSPWIMDIEDGTPPQVVETVAGGLDVSPDGKSIAFVDEGQTPSTLTVCALPSCTSRQSFIAAVAAGPIWTPDRRAVAYVDAASPTNIWLRPLDGTRPRQLTHFTDGPTITDFAWTRDGKRLAVARATIRNDMSCLRGDRDGFVLTARIIRDRQDSPLSAHSPGYGWSGSQAVKK